MAPPRLSWFRRPEGAGYVPQAPWMSDAEGSASGGSAAGSSGRPAGARPGRAPPRPPPPPPAADPDDPDLAAALAASLAGTRIADDGGDTTTTTTTAALQGASAAEAENRAVAAAKRLSLAGDGGRSAALSYKLWATGELGYADAVADGLYDVAGSFDGVGGGVADDGSGPPGTPLFPALADLARTLLPPGDSREVTVVDFCADAPLRAVDGTAAAALADACSAGPAACVSALARVVITAGGGPGSAAALAAAAAAALPALRSARRGAAVLPLGDRLARGPGAPPGSASLRHRALLFKALADACALPCRLTHVRAGRPPPPGGSPADPALIHVTVDRQEWLVDLGAPPAAAAAWAVTAAPPTRALVQPPPPVEEAAAAAARSPPPPSADGGGGSATAAASSAKQPSPSAAAGPVPALPPPPGDAPRERAAAAVAAATAAAAASAAASPAAEDGTSAAVARTAARLQAAADAAAAATPSTPGSAVAPADSTATPPGTGLAPPRTSVALIDLTGSDELGDDAASTAAESVGVGGGGGGGGGERVPDRPAAACSPPPPPPHVVHSSSAPDLVGLAGVGTAPAAATATTTTTSPFAAAPVPPPPLPPQKQQAQPPPPPGAALPPHHASSVPLPARAGGGAGAPARPRPSAEAAAGLRAARAAAAGLPTPAILDPFVGLSPFPPAVPAAGPSAKDLLARVPAVDAPGRGGASAFHEFAGAPGGPSSSATPAPAAPPPTLPPLRNEPPGGGVGRFLGETSTTTAATPSAAMTSTTTTSQPGTATADDDDPWEIDPAEIVMGPRIGIGSFGEVFRAQWRKTDVAVKLLFGLDADGPAAVAEFRREVGLMRKLKHPNIVQFLGGVTGNRPWPALAAGGAGGNHPATAQAIVTQFCAGGSLFKVLHRRGAGPRPVFDNRRCARMALDVARGMHYLHSCSPPIIHRDLKSPNLLVDAGGVIRVCDFGLSAVRSGRTYLSARSRAGTPEWTAPEVLRSQGCNEKSDVYSFAVVLWELFTQQEPWASLTSVQVVGQVGFGGARLPIPPTVPPAIASLIEDCWADDPRTRPDFGVIIDRLTAFFKAEAAVAGGNGGNGGGGSSTSGAA